MAKLTFKDIPTFPRAQYEVDIGWSYLEHWLGQQFEVGLNIDPDFQRGHVWTPAQQVAYIEYVLQGGEVGKQLIFNCTNWDRFSEPGVFVLIDGKQRLEAVRKFLRDEVKVFGDNVCSAMGKLPLIDYGFRARIMKLRTRADMLRLYLSLNAGGTPHDPKEIARVRKLLEEEKAS